MKITKVTTPDALCCQYEGQMGQQPCFLYLDCKDETLSCDYDPEIGNGVPMDVWHGHRIRFLIPALDAEAANELMESVESLSRVIVAGYRSVWDGSNHIARFDEAAEAAKEEIEQECERYADDQRRWCYCHPCDWYNGHETVNADTTDADIAEMAEDDEAAAREQYTKVPADRIARYLTGCRDELRAEATP